MDTVVIYHDNCADGFASMMVAKQAMPDAEMFPCNYQNFKLDTDENGYHLMLTYKGKMIDLKNKHVYVVDFSFKRVQMDLIRTYAKTLLVLDHHKTAEEELKDYPGAVFDMKRAGCQMIWEHFFSVPPPEFIHLIGKRDIWAHKGTPFERDAEALNLYIQTIGYDIKKWGAFWEDETLETCLIQGRALLDFFTSKINEAIGHAIAVNFQGKSALVVNAPYWMSSELGNVLSKISNFGVVWSMAQDRRFICSLRSSDGTDVSAIAKMFGGGGHGPAAGCMFDTYEELCNAFLGVVK